MKTNLIEQVVNRRGVKDPEALLLSFGSDAPMARAMDPDVRGRGSIQIMKDERVYMDDVNAELENLKYL